jgi:transcription termination/antitermination protein NusG
MEQCDFGTRWYAIQVRSRFEFATGNILQSKGFELFVPRYRSKRRWSDRKVELDLPLFPGYIFCRFDARACRPIITTAGVVRIVGTSKMPSPLEAHEIEAVQRVVQHECKVEPHAFMTVGSRVRIQGGPLAGLEGIVTGHKNRRLILSIALVQQSISMEVEDLGVAVISSSMQDEPATSTTRAGFNLDPNVVKAA